MGCGAVKVYSAAGLGGEVGVNIKDSVKVGAFGRVGFIIDAPGRIAEFYDIDHKKLREGSYGTVSRCTNKSTGVARAVKSIFKARVLKNQYTQEIAIMKIMDHPNIIKLYECFEDHHNIYLIFELCMGGELLDRIIDAGHFTERQAVTVMHYMFRAVSYMHNNKICHRDLTPESFLFTTSEPVDKSELKVISFGWACRFAQDQLLTTRVGSPYYMAPQVLAGKYDQCSDMWSLGVIMYVVLCGYPPFYGETDADVLAQVRLGNFSFNAADWNSVSEDAKNLIRMLLKMNPCERYTAELALNDTWVRKEAARLKVVEEARVQEETMKNEEDKRQKAAVEASVRADDEVCRKATTRSLPSLTNKELVSLTQDSKSLAILTQSKPRATEPKPFAMTLPFSRAVQTSFVGGTAEAPSSPLSGSSPRISAQGTIFYVQHELQGITVVKQEGADTWFANNSRLQSWTKGIEYRWTKLVEEQNKTNVLAWSPRNRGTDEGDGCIKIEKSHRDRLAKVERGLADAALCAASSNILVADCLVDAAASVMPQRNESEHGPLHQTYMRIRQAKIQHGLAHAAAGAATQNIDVAHCLAKAAASVFAWRNEYGSGISVLHITPRSLS